MIVKLKDDLEIQLMEIIRLLNNDNKCRVLGSCKCYLDNQILDEYKEEYINSKKCNLKLNKDKGKVIAIY